MDRAIVKEGDESSWKEIFERYSISWNSCPANELITRVCVSNMAVCFRVIPEAQQFYLKYRGDFDSQRPIHILALPEERDTQEFGDIAQIMDDGTWSIRKLRSLLN